MQIRIGLRKGEREDLISCLHQAYKTRSLRLVKRVQAIIYVVDGYLVSEVAHILDLSEQSIDNYINGFVLRRLDSFDYKRPPGRPAKLTKTQKKELCKLIDDGPLKAGYDCGCWDSSLIQDLILSRYGVEYQ